MQRALRLVEDHAVAAAAEDGHTFAALALLDDEHRVLRGAEARLADAAQQH